MSRREFGKPVRVAAIKRAAGFCEECGKPHLNRFEIDHVIADALGGEPVLSNARVLCVVCHGVKTKVDTTAAAKSKRREATHLGAKLRGQSFRPPAPKDRSCSKTVERRSLFVEESP